MSGELLGEFKGFLLELRHWMQFVHETDRQRQLPPSTFFARRIMSSAYARPMVPGQTGGPAPGGDSPEIGSRKADLRSLGCRQAEVARQRKLESSAEAVPKKRGDDRLVELFDHGQNPQPLIEHRLESTSALRTGDELL